MDDLISRGQLKAAMYREVFHKDSNLQKWDGVCWIRYKLFEKVTDSLPSELVRCKDCKWFGKVGCAVMIADDYDKPTENDYCSFAERRKGVMDDLISRQAAIDAADRVDYTGIAVEDVKKVTDEVVKELKKLPSVQNVPDRNVGEWDMFELITSVWYGKQCYFVEENGIVYSRVSCKHMIVDEAIKEFLGRIGDDGRI